MVFFGPARRGKKAFQFPARAVAKERDSRLRSRMIWRNSPR